MSYEWELKELSFDKEVWELGLWSNPPAKKKLFSSHYICNTSNRYPILVVNERIGAHNIEIQTFLPIKDNPFNIEVNSSFNLYDTWDGHYHTCYFLDGKFVEGITPYKKEVKSVEDFKYGLNQYFCRFVENFAGETLTKLITNSNLPKSHINAVRELLE